MAVLLAIHALVFSFRAKMCDTQPGIYENSHLAGILCFTGGRVKARVAHLTRGRRYPEEETRDVSGASKTSIKASLTASLKGALCGDG